MAIPIDIFGANSARARAESCYIQLAENDLISDEDLDQAVSHTGRLSEIFQSGVDKAREFNPLVGGSTQENETPSSVIQNAETGGEILAHPGYNPGIQSTHTAISGSLTSSEFAAAMNAPYYHQHGILPEPISHGAANITSITDLKGLLIEIRSCLTKIEDQDDLVTSVLNAEDKASPSAKLGMHQVYKKRSSSEVAKAKLLVDRCINSDIFKE